MNFHRSTLSQRSEKKKLREAIGKLHLQILRNERGDVCEICGGPGPVGRFHIIRVADAYRLEFEPENILLSHWLEKCQAHYRWHHYGSNHPANAETELKIQLLRGTDYMTRLRTIEKFKDKNDMLRLRLLYKEFKQRLGE
jgi:hypothetical protein